MSRCSIISTLHTLHGATTNKSKSYVGGKIFDICLPPPYESCSSLKFATHPLSKGSSSMYRYLISSVDAMKPEHLASASDWFYVHRYQDLAIWQIIGNSLLKRFGNENVSNADLFSVPTNYTVSSPVPSHVALSLFGSFVKIGYHHMYFDSLATSNEELAVPCTTNEKLGNHSKGLLAHIDLVRGSIGSCNPQDLYSTLLNFISSNYSYSQLPSHAYSTDSSELEPRHVITLLEGLWWLTYNKYHYRILSSTSESDSEDHNYQHSVAECSDGLLLLPSCELQPLTSIAHATTSSMKVEGLLTSLQPVVSKHIHKMINRHIVESRSQDPRSVSALLRCLPSTARLVSLLSDLGIPHHVLYVSAAQAVSTEIQFASSEVLILLLKGFASSGYSNRLLCQQIGESLEVAVDSLSIPLMCLAMEAFSSIGMIHTGFVNCFCECWLSQYSPDIVSPMYPYNMAGNLHSKPSRDSLNNIDKVSGMRLVCSLFWSMNRLNYWNEDIVDYVSSFITDAYFNQSSRRNNLKVEGLSDRVDTTEQGFRVKADGSGTSRNDWDWDGSECKEHLAFVSPTTYQYSKPLNITDYPALCSKASLKLLDRKRQSRNSRLCVHPPCLNGIRSAALIELLYTVAMSNVEPAYTCVYVITYCLEIRLKSGDSISDFSLLKLAKALSRLPSCTHPLLIQLSNSKDLTAFTKSKSVLQILNEACQHASSGNSAIPTVFSSTTPDFLFLIVLHCAPPIVSSRCLEVAACGGGDEKCYSWKPYDVLKSVIRVIHSTLDMSLTGPFKNAKRRNDTTDSKVLMLPSNSENSNTLEVSTKAIAGSNCITSKEVCIAEEMSSLEKLSEDCRSSKPLLNVSSTKLDRSVMYRDVNSSWSSIDRSLPIDDDPFLLRKTTTLRLARRTLTALMMCVLVQKPVNVDFGQNKKHEEKILSKTQSRKKKRNAVEMKTNDEHSVLEILDTETLKNIHRITSQCMSICGGNTTSSGQDDRNAHNQGNTYNRYSRARNKDFASRSPTPSNFHRQVRQAIRAFSDEILDTIKGVNHLCIRLQV